VAVGAFISRFTLMYRPAEILPWVVFLAGVWLFNANE